MAKRQEHLEHVADAAAHEGMLVEWDEWYINTIEEGDGDLLVMLGEKLSIPDLEYFRHIIQDDQNAKVIAGLAFTTLQHLAHRRFIRSQEPT